jgi:exocyst complex component 2
VIIVSRFKEKGVKKRKVMASQTGLQPQVTGISPKEGPPGTKVTIRGERLGKSQADVIGLDICGVDCILTCEWVSPNKILARTLLCKTKGDIIIVTRSGGVGSSTVQFRGEVFVFMSVS